MRTPFISVNRRVRPQSEPRARTQAGDNLRGAGLMVASMAAFIANDTAIKHVTQTLPLPQAILVRGALVLILLWFIAQRDGGIVWRPELRRDRRLLTVRTLGEVASTLLYLTALQHMALGSLSAIMQSLPLLVMLAAAVAFRERIGWRRLSAVAVGVAGVLLILRPGTAAFNLWSVVALGAVLMIVLRDITTRSLGPEIRSSTVAFHAALAVTASAFVMPSDVPWRLPTIPEVGWLGLAALFLSGGYLTAVATMRVGEVAFVSPFRYTSLIFAATLGYVFFDERPDGWTLIGATLIVLAGLYSIWRETRLRGGS
ncbi:DMT family transporter [uncultured Paracoccus sp.]|uniref:DMT family transporter n=1 Tax=uncultured Paracoccus sp. TaxID=189685 RepID=UPI00260E46F0|nr:DMT family transporter [uncultured Paracoccus sp.]